MVVFVFMNGFSSFLNSTFSPSPRVVRVKLAGFFRVRLKLALRQNWVFVCGRAWIRSGFWVRFCLRFSWDQKWAFVCGLFGIRTGLLLEFGHPKLRGGLR